LQQYHQRCIAEPIGPYVPTGKMTNTDRSAEIARILPVLGVVNPGVD